MNIVASFVTHTKASKLEEQAKAASTTPADLSETASVLGVASGNQRLDASLAHGLSNFGVEVVGAIAQEGLRALARPANGARDRLDGIKQGDGHLGVVRIGTGVLDGQRRAIAIGDQHNSPHEPKTR